MLGYVPFSRRKVASILPPLAAAPGQPKFMHTLHRLVTVAAPWTSEERWRAKSAKLSNSDDDEDDVVDEDIEPFTLEKEHATIEEPDTLEIWFEADQFAAGLRQSIVGVGMRGRWAFMDMQGGHQWWTFKAKDCELIPEYQLIYTVILPAFWQS